jgi:hypothetical protein
VRTEFLETTGKRLKGGFTLFSIEGIEAEQIIQPLIIALPWK